jgi:hypothetical protein
MEDSMDKEQREELKQEMSKELKPLVVTTAHRGVFFGYGIPSDAPTIRLEKAQMCLYWPVENKGVVGLAVDGPLKGARVGPAAPVITLLDVTAVMEVTEEAEKRWMKKPWS